MHVQTANLYGRKETYIFRSSIIRELFVSLRLMLVRLIVVLFSVFSNEGF